MCMSPELLYKFAAIYNLNNVIKFKKAVLTYQQGLKYKVFQS